MFRDPDTWVCLILSLNFLLGKYSKWPGINISLHPPKKIIVVDVAPGLQPGKPATSWKNNSRGWKWIHQSGIIQFRDPPSFSYGKLNIIHGWNHSIMDVKIIPKWMFNGCYTILILFSIFPQAHLALQLPQMQRHVSLHVSHQGRAKNGPLLAS